MSESHQLIIRKGRNLRFDNGGNSANDLVMNTKVQFFQYLNISKWWICNYLTFSKTYYEHAELQTVHSQLLQMQENEGWQRMNAIPW